LLSVAGRPRSGVVPPDATPPAASESRSPVLDADVCGVLGPASLAEPAASSVAPESLICSGDRATLGTRYRDPTPSAHTPKTIIRLIVTACIRSFYGPG
jgi:hypothetical protein